MFNLWRTSTVGRCRALKFDIKVCRKGKIGAGVHETASYLHIFFNSIRHKFFVQPNQPKVSEEIKFAGFRHKTAVKQPFQHKSYISNQVDRRRVSKTF
jgi:hypothetical protein